jgi:hypothetical protein
MSSTRHELELLRKEIELLRQEVASLRLQIQLGNPGPPQVPAERYPYWPQPYGVGDDPNYTGPTCGNNVVQSGQRIVGSGFFVAKHPDLCTGDELKAGLHLQSVADRANQSIKAFESLIAQQICNNPKQQQTSSHLDLPIGQPHME